jgi:predicted transcriptional regulator
VSDMPPLDRLSAGRFEAPAIESDLQVSRITAMKYLDALTEGGFLQKEKIGRSNYYINIALNQILIGKPMQGGGNG